MANISGTVNFVFNQNTTTPSQDIGCAIILDSATNQNEVIDSEAITIVNGPGPYTIQNNFLEAFFNILFTGGGGGLTANTATVTTASLTQVTLSTVVNLKVGDLLALQVPTFTNLGGNPSNWTVGQVTNISGTVVTFTPTGPDSNSSNPPSTPGQARWNGINPTDIQIRRNTFNSRPEWAIFGTAKSYFEAKNGVRVTIDGNVFQGRFSNIALQNRNQTGDAPWSVNKDFTISNNLFAAGGFIIVGIEDGLHTTLQGSNLLVTNNLFRVPSPAQPGQTYLAFTGGGTGVTFSHNTVRSNSDSMLFGALPAVSGVIFRDNVLNSGSYFFNCTKGDTSLATCWPGFSHDHSIVINTSRAAPPAYMSSDFVVNNDAAIGFVNAPGADAGGDYHGYALSSASTFKGRASDGTDPGVNFQVLDAALGPSGRIVRSRPRRRLVEIAEMSRLRTSGSIGHATR